VTWMAEMAPDLTPQVASQTLDAVAREIMTSLKRGGADFIVSYWALDLMEWLKS